MLNLKNITRVYSGKEYVVNALCGVTLSFRENELVSILGPSGCGKTTLLNIIGGLDRYTSGDIDIEGISTKEFRDENWDSYRNATIGFVFQSYNLIPHLTVAQNVELAMSLSGIPKAERQKRIKEALEKVGMGGELKKKPGQLSGGQAQRVAIARALVNNPKIILADEPTGALDSDLSLQVMDILTEIAKTRLVIMVTHNNELAERYSTRIIGLRDGFVVKDTAPFGDSKVSTPEEMARFKAERSAASVEASSKPNDDLKPFERRNEYVCAVCGSANPAGSASCGRCGARLPRERFVSLKLFNTKVGRKVKNSYGADAGSADAEVAPKRKLKKKEVPFRSTSMTFKTAFQLSFTNMMAKKRRTFLTSFAGSIGIIGLSLILALSTGMTNFIQQMQQTILAAVPIGVYEYSLDYKAMTDMFENYADVEMVGSFPDSDEIYINQREASNSDAINGILSMLLESVSTNKMSPEFVEYLKGMDKSWYAAINYYYAVRMNILKDVRGDDGSYAVKDLSIDTPVCSAMTIATTVLGDKGLQTANWNQLFGSLEFIKSNYDVLEGNYPQNYDEIVLVVDEDNKVNASALAAFGLDIYQRDADGAVKKNQAGDPILKESLKFSDVLGETYKLALNNDYYVNKGDGTYRYPQEAELGNIYNSQNCVDLKVVGVLRIKPKADVSIVGCCFSYTEELAKFVLDNSHKSDIAVQQAANNAAGNRKNVFGGLVPSNSDIASNPLNFMLGGLTYSAMMKSLGVDTTPSYINIYPSDFSNKDKIVDYLDEWDVQYGNMKYFDVSEMFIHNMQIMVNLMTYCLIAFASVSLIVSSIMIGVITGNSVSERIREIGILRSLGARKRDIANVFNVETSILGLYSGALGIGIGYALFPFINWIFEMGVGVPGMLFLKPLHAILLVVLSWTLTFIAGLIPSQIAANKNVVDALRVE